MNTSAYKQDPVKAFIAMRIKEIRLQHHLTQQEFGASFDIPRSTATVSSWEKCRTTPDADTLLEICKRYNASIRSFYPPIEETAACEHLSSEELELVNLFRKMGTTYRSLILLNARTMADNENEGVK